VQAIQTSSHKVNAVLLRLAPGFDARAVAGTIVRWQRYTAYTRDDMEEILVAKLIATAARQIGLFLLILAVVSAAIVAFIIYTMTLGKIKEIAVLKLIGSRDRTIAAMIMQEALGLGVIGFFVGKFACHPVGAGLPKICIAGNRRRRPRLRADPGGVRAGLAAGDPRRAQDRPGGGDRG